MSNAEAELGGRRLRWGLVGASTMAHEFVGPALRAGGHHVVGIATRSPARGAEVADALGGAPVFATVEQLLETVEPDAVYVSSTNEHHAPQTLAAARAGVHVLCEKPLATTLEDAHAMVATCREQGVLLATNHHLRNAAAHRRLHELIAQGTLGEPLAVRLHHAVWMADKWRGWRLSEPGAGGGVVLDLTVHDVDLLRFLLDDEVASVSAIAGRQGLSATPAIEDAAMAVLRFRRGTMVQCHDAYTVPNSRTALELYGTEAAAFVLDAMAGRPIATLTLRRDGVEEPVALTQPASLYERAVQAFAAAVAGEGRPAATGEDGLRSLAVALAVKRSAELGCELELDAAVGEASQ
jgi:1,5-anhydro-D-fructose reductase (1,5-anhydro-D-mannitol-forming)